MTYFKHFIDEVELALILALVLFFVTALMIISVEIMSFLS